MEEVEEVDRTDPAYQQLTRHIARLIRELELVKLDRIAV